MKNTSYGKGAWENRSDMSDEPSDFSTGKKKKALNIHNAIR